MNEPAPTADKSEWRAWARTLETVELSTATSVSGHVADLVRTAGGFVLGYEPLPDEVPVDVVPDAVALLDDDGRLLLSGPSGAVSVADIGLVLVPGRVFDRDGYRLGRGGGHYDRLLPALVAHVPVVGVTCTARLVDRLPREPHDVPMTHLVTEHGIHPTNSTREHAVSVRNFVENDEGGELDS